LKPKLPFENTIAETYILMNSEVLFDSQVIGKHFDVFNLIGILVALKAEGRREQYAIC
jgi:hypothetical protein